MKIPANFGFNFPCSFREKHQNVKVNRQWQTSSDDNNIKT
jgi:hypothetical protein